MDWKTYYFYAGYRCGYRDGHQRRRHRKQRVRRSIKIAMGVIPTAIALLVLIAVTDAALPDRVQAAVHQVFNMLYWFPFYRVK